MTDARLDFLMLTLAQVREAAPIALTITAAHPPAHLSPEALSAALKTTWN